MKNAFNIEFVEATWDIMSFVSTKESFLPEDKMFLTLTKTYIKHYFVPIL